MIVPRTRLTARLYLFVLETLKPSTLDRYARALAHHILPGLGDYFVDAVTHQGIVLWRDAQTAKTSTIKTGR